MEAAVPWQVQDCRQALASILLAEHREAQSHFSLHILVQADSRGLDISLDSPGDKCFGVQGSRSVQTDYTPVHLADLHIGWVLGNVSVGEKGIDLEPYCKADQAADLVGHSGDWAVQI